MERIVLKNSRWQYLLLFLGSLGFIAAGVFLVATGKAPFAGWTAIAFFGACALVFVWQLVDSRPRLIIDENGILDRQLGLGVIPWSEILDAYVRSVMDNHFVCLVLRDPEKFARRLPKLRRFMASANRALGFTDFSINLSGVSVRPEVIHELVMKQVEAEKLKGLMESVGASHRP